MRVLLLVVAVVALGGACAPSLREVVRDTVDEHTRPENLRKLRVLARVLAAEITKGVEDGALSPESRQDIERAIDEYVRRFLAAVAAETGKDLSPAIADTVRASVRAAVDEILNDRTVRRAEEVMDRLSAAAFSDLSRGMESMVTDLRSAIGSAMADVLKTDLGPAMRDVLDKEIGPALAAMIDRDFVPVIENGTRRASTAAAEGFMDGLTRRLDPLLDRVQTRIDATASNARQSARSIAELLVVAALAFVATCFGFALVLIARRAKSRHEALHLVVREISSMSQAPAIQRLAERIHRAGEGNRGGDYLESHLRRHPELRVRKVEKLA